MVKTLNFFSDPGHGWLKVKKAELVKFGLIESISSYSYERNDSVYLEEDCDAYLWQHSHNGRYGVDPEVEIVQHDDIEVEYYPETNKLKIYAE